MNRAKLWAYMLLLLGAGAVQLFLVSSTLTARSVAALDRGLDAAASQAEVRLQLLARSVRSVAEGAARDPALLRALFEDAPTTPARGRRGRPAPPAAPDDPTSAAHHAGVERAARSAVEGAAHDLGVDLPGGSFWAASDSKGGGSQAEAAGFLRDAAKGTARQGFVRIGDNFFYGAAAAAGRGAAVVLFVPVDLAWAQELRKGSGADVTLLPDPRQPAPAFSTLPSATARSVAAAARRGIARAIDVGELTSVKPAPVGFVDLPPLPLLFSRAPALRAAGVPLAGSPAQLVLSLSSTPLLAPLALYQGATLAVLAVLFLVGLVLGLTMTRAEPAQTLPRELLAAADKIDHGDFAARAPTYAGKLGTVASALNRAAAAAFRDRLAPTPLPEPAAAFPPSPPAAQPTSVGLSAFDIPAGRTPERREETTEREFIAPGAPRRTTEPMYGGGEAPAPPRPVPATPAPAFPAATGPTDNEAHWQQVFQEFLRMREQCGEPLEGLTFDRFRLKLEKNREQLIQKYGCKSVRFQVYVKDGKAALKATPVR